MRARTSVVAAATTLALVAAAGLAAAQPPPPPPPLPPSLPPPLVVPAEPAPPGTPYRIGYVSTAESSAASGPDAVEPADVWSADEAGDDRRNHTARPDLREDGPAYSPDGAWLAYSAHDAGGGARIVIADAEGRDGRVLAPAGTLATDLDQHPTWSPDGTMIAFARQPAAPDGEPTSEILVVRVADGQQLGQVPMPAPLVGRDLAPAWSPDGTRIAFARTASRRPPPTAEPPTVDVPGLPGDTLEIPLSVLVPEIPVRPDIVFLIDASLSMGSAIGDVRQNVGTIVDTVRADQPTARFALAYYRDGAVAADLAAGFEFFDVLQPLTEDGTALAEALAGLQVAGGGGDGPEDWIYPLHQLATGTPDLPEERRVVFGPGRSPIIVLIGDASSREPSVAPGTAHRLTAEGGEGDGDTMLALLAAGVRVVAVDVDSGSPFADGLNGDRTSPPRRPPVPDQGTLVAERTGGVFVPPGEGADAVSAAIITGLLGIPVPVTAQVEACDPGLTATVVPPSQEVQGGDTAQFTATVAVASGAPGGAILSCLIGYEVGDGSRVVQQVVVRVGDGVSPQVRVDDVTVETTDPTGAVVDYPAAAAAVAGEPLTPTCVPPPGSRFPVGTTVVACTATDAAGNTGSDTALVNVVLGPADGLTRIWLATLAFPAAGTGAAAVLVTDQVDLSATVGPGCTGGDHDTEPAWSPDAAALVFADLGGSPSLCLVDLAGGAAARALVGLVDGGVVRDPAWSLDGTFVAFGVDRSSALGREAIWAVPVTDPATPEPLIVDDGHQGQPAFRRLPDPTTEPLLALSVTVTPAPGFVGGDDLVVRYAVRNDSTVALAGVALVADLPAELPATAATPGCGSATSCALGVVPAGATVEVLVRLAPAVAVEDVAAGQVTGSVVDGPAATASASAAVVVREPVLEISPEVGPPGLVAHARGTDFPPGAQVRLVWRDGITATADTVTVAPDGTFTWPALVFRKDALGPRELHAEPVTGPAFGTATVDFLVVPRTQQPPLFEGRG